MIKRLLIPDRAPVLFMSSFEILTFWIYIYI